ncbi:MAG: hypothetical protein KJ970_15685 [Candidatus Eisenbacteria bacterium]|uniref:FlgD/Vpr Ig-like domain-containing protein n=1 Tax=Eiseniibacteriota bacterium TaxID=2212470 RepID=A0A948W796_UNCEI|nr:hypothetical protein [Candidatus Eisenbacteria bacterium]MBU1948091.1 hypothetical protein [Candidatus Eisenbacteria bacterium]MBU2692364.1 hypothetical protein [Candidatus Eisenbacteria bacterium]
MTGVLIQIFDINGRLIRTLVEGSIPAGEHSVRWDGRGDGGQMVGAGVYFCTSKAKAGGNHGSCL